VVFKQAKPKGFDLPFEDAIRFFKGKDGVFMPTNSYRDMVGEAHAHAFMVAGAAKMDMLRDFYDAVEKAIKDGTTLEAFQKDFDQIVTKYGWDYTGDRAWRSQIIFETNLNTAYAAGRWEQMRDPAVLEDRPFWQYRIGFAIHHRPPHEAMNWYVAPASDPVWSTIYPPNGYGCHCWVKPLTEAEAAGFPQLTQTMKDAFKPDEGWAHNVGDAWRQGFADVMGRKIADTPSPLAQAFLDSLPAAMRKLIAQE